MSKAFNDLSAVGSAHALKDTKNINEFEKGLKDPQEIHWCNISKEHWEIPPPAEQTFDRIYNNFSKYTINYKSLSSGSNRSSRIVAFNTQGVVEHECGRGRDCRRGSGRGRGQRCVRGRERGRGQGHNPYSLYFTYGNGIFIPEAKIYDKFQNQKISQDQQNAIQEIESAADWINGYTPSNGHNLDDKGYGTLSTSLIFSVQRYISQTTTNTYVHQMVPLFPPLSQTPYIPPIINTDPNKDGTEFGRQGSRTPYQTTDNLVRRVSAL